MGREARWSETLLVFGSINLKTDLVGIWPYLSEFYMSHHLTKPLHFLGIYPMEILVNACKDVFRRNWVTFLLVIPGNWKLLEYL